MKICFRSITLLIISCALFQCSSSEASNPAPKVGDAVPEFSLLDQGGNTINLSDLKGKTVVLEWTNPDCPFVKRHYKEATMKQLASEYGEKEVVWLAINSTHYMDAGTNKKWKEENGLPYAILDDKPGTVGKLFGAITTPHMFVIDGEGKLAYQGAIDDDSRGWKAVDKRSNYVSAALDNILAGKPVATGATKPYGCSVKYAS